MCESAARDAFGEDALVVRPGLIVGPHDPTDRFTWWPWRVAKGGRVAAPGRPARTVQFIDVRDLARWCVALVENDARGTYNAAGPREPLAMSRLLDACRMVSGSDASFEWIDEPSLEKHGVAPWKEMPLWVPESDPHAAGFMSVPIARALATGLTFTPLEQTIADTLAWARTRPADHVWKAGLDVEQEKKLVSETF
jgi:2'-hydroxyisoflavone reductase